MSSDVGRSRERRLRAALGLNVGIVVLQVVVGIAASSLGLLADAGHNLSDVAALVVSMVAVRLALRPPTSERSFGLHRGTILAAQVNAASVLVVCVLISIEAIRRIADPHPVEGGLVVVVALLGAVVNLAAVVALGGHHRHGPGEAHGHDHEDLNVRSAVLHLVGDAAASVGVAAAGAVILLTGGWYWLDPLASLAIAVLIGWQGWRLLREAMEVLLESAPAGLDVAGVADAITGVDGVDAVHDLHVWTLSSDLRALSAHLVLSGHPTLEEAQVVGARAKAVLAEVPWRIAHATLELECEACGEPVDWCAIDEDPAGAATAHGLAHPHDPGHGS
jgi:cobalt-zinc-cadmium efflux system protein